jgi:hypothetical protein
LATVSIRREAPAVFRVIVEKTSSPRFELVLDRLEAGDALLFYDIGVRFEGPDVLLVSIRSAWGEHH